MQCVRCGAIFEGRFYPRCGAPAMAAPAAQGEPMGWPCPRCGTLFRGNFCPRCGLPTAAWAYRPPATPSGGRTVLSILWTLALVGFIIFVITDVMKPTRASVHRIERTVRPPDGVAGGR